MCACMCMCVCVRVLTPPSHPSRPSALQLACEGGVAHVVVMPSVGVDKLRSFVDELVESRARAGAAEEGVVVPGLEAVML